MAIVMEPKMPTGTEVASYQTYAQARAGVDFLSDYGFDVSSITIVGTDLHMVERVTGRLTIARASMSGASSGGLWGALAGMFMSAGQNAGGTGTWVVGGIVIGALVGMALSALAFILRGRNRDLLSSQQVVAERYAILAASDIDRAFTLLQRTPGNMARPKRAREVTERPKKDSIGFFPDGRPRFGAATKEGDIPSVRGPRPRLRRARTRPWHRRRSRRPSPRCPPRRRANRRRLRHPLSPRPHSPRLNDATTPRPRPLRETRPRRRISVPKRRVSSEKSARGALSVPGCARSTPRRLRWCAGCLRRCA